MVTDLIAEREYLEIYARRYSDGAEAGATLIRALTFALVLARHKNYRDLAAILCCAYCLEGRRGSLLIPRQDSIEGPNFSYRETRKG